MIVPYYLIHLKSLIHIKKPLDFMVSIIYLLVGALSYDVTNTTKTQKHPPVVSNKRDKV